MNCKNCGTVLNATDKFCLNCGTPVDLPAPAAPVTTLVQPTPEQMVQMAPVAQEVPMAPVQPVMPQPIEAGIAEYSTNGLPVGQPAPEPEQTTIPVGPSLSMNNGVVQQEPVVPMATPTHVIPGAPVAPTPGYVPPTPVEPKKDNKKLFIIIGGIVLVTAAIVVALVIILGKDKNESKDDDKKDNDTSVKEPEKQPEKEPEVPEVSTYQVSIGNFVVTVPNDYKARMEENYVIFENDKYHLEVIPHEGYTLMNATIDDIKNYLIDLNVTVTNIEERTVNGAAYFVARGYFNGVESAFIFTKSTSLYYLISYGARLDYVYSDDIVITLISLLEDVKYSPSTNLNTGDVSSNLKPLN